MLRGRAKEQAFQVDLRDHRLLLEVVVDEVAQQLRRVVHVAVEVLDERVQLLLDAG